MFFFMPTIFRLQVRVKEMQLLEEESGQEFRFLLITKDASEDLFLEMRSSNSFQLTYRLKVVLLPRDKRIVDYNSVGNWFIKLSTCVRKYSTL